MSKQNDKLKGRGGAQPRKFPKSEWHFDEAGVPPDELVACCFWEYARESATLRKLRQRCVEACQADGNADSLIPIVAGNIRHQHNSAEVFLREIVLQLSQGDGFPKPWQSLSEDARRFRARLFDKGMTPYIPFRRGRLRDAQSILRTVMEQRKVALNPNINPLKVGRIATGTPLVAGTPFEWTDREDRLPGGFLYPDGTEVSVVEIDWAHCTNKEIGELLAKHRPTSIPEPPTGRGHKPVDWRSKLISLGLLRLRHVLSTEDVIQLIAGSLPRDKRKATKFTEPSELNREAKKALDYFHELLPFLDPAERPRCWPVK